MTKPRGFYLAPPTDEQLLTAIIDLDGTIAESTWHPEQTRSVIGDPIDHGIDQLIRLYLNNYRIVIFTARAWADHDMIVAWLIENEIPFHQVICGKPLGTVYIDDKAVNASADSWAPALASSVAVA